MLGTKDIPRLVVHRSLKHISAQLIDDTTRGVLFSLSSFDKELRQKLPNFGNLKSAQILGEEFSRRLKEQGFTRIIFDRAGYLYHGRIKQFAEALRKGGLEF